jgi:hypothetical protein
MFKRVIAVALVAASIGLLAVPTASAAKGPSLDQCVVHVLRTTSTGELKLSAPNCYPTRSEAMAAEHVGAWGVGASARAAVTNTTFTIGYHCDGYDLTGPCTSVVGTGCTGGWLNTSTAWNNRISSTENGCPTVRHFDGANLTGASVNTTGVGSYTNLVTFNNKTSSLQYL